MKYKILILLIFFSILISCNVKGDLLTNLTAYWSMDGNGNQLSPEYDTRGNFSAEYIPDVGNPLSYLDQLIDGKIYRGVHFYPDSGTAPVLNVTNATGFNLYYGGSFAISLWFNSTSTAGHPFIYMNAYNVTDGLSIGQIRLGLTSNRLRFRIADGEDNPCVLSISSATAALTTNVWHHAVLSMDVNNVTLYVDNTTRPMNFTKDSGGVCTPDFIGKDTLMSFVTIGGSADFDGSIILFSTDSLDDIAFWNRALNESDVNELYNASYGYYLGGPEILVTYNNDTTPNGENITGPLIVNASINTFATTFSNLTFNLYNGSGYNINSTFSTDPEFYATISLTTPDTYYYNITGVSNDTTFTAETRSMTLLQTILVVFNNDTPQDNTILDNSTLLINASMNETVVNFTFNLYNNSGYNINSTFSTDPEFYAIYILDSGYYYFNITAYSNTSSYNTETRRIRVNGQNYTDIISYWSMEVNDNIDVVNDLINVSIYGNISGGAINTTGIFFGAVNYTAFNQIILTNTQIMPTESNPRSVNAWFRLHDFPTFNDQTNTTAYSAFIVGTGVQSFHQDFEILVQNRSNICAAYLRTYYDDQASNFSCDNITTGWHMVTVTFDGIATDPGLKFYIDGVFLPERILYLDPNITLNTSNINNFAWFGQSYNDPTEIQMNGSVDEVGIWDRVLTQNDITYLYNNSYGAFLSQELSTILYNNDTEVDGTVKAENFIYVNITSDNPSGLVNNTINLYDHLGNLVYSNTSTENTFAMNFTGLTQQLYYFNAYTISTDTSVVSTNTRTVTILVTPTINFVNFTTPSGFTNNPNIIMNVNISGVNPQYINYSVYNGSGDLYNSNLSTNVFCYQESANTTNQTGIDGNCNLNYSGNYTFEGNWFTSNDNLIDGNFSSGGYSLSNNANFTIFYKIPDQITSAMWIIKDARSQINLTIPEDCWNWSVNNNRFLGVRVRFAQVGLSNTLYYSCFNTTSTVHTLNVYSVPFKGNRNFYEEAVQWSLFSNFSTSVSSGQYFFNATVYDSTNLTNTTETRNITISTTQPNITFTLPTPNNNSYISHDYIEWNVSVNLSIVTLLNVSLYDNNSNLINSTINTESGVFYNLSIGRYILEAIVFDVFGNNNSDARIITYYILTAGSIISPVFNQSINNTLFINYTAFTSPVNISYYYIQLLNNDTIFNQNITPFNDLNLTYNWSNIYNHNLSQNYYIINVVAVDTQNNSISAQQQYYQQYTAQLNFSIYDTSTNAKYQNYTINLSDGRIIYTNSTYTYIDVVGDELYNITINSTKFMLTTINNYNMSVPVNVINQSINESIIQYEFRDTTTGALIIGTNISMDDVLNTSNPVYYTTTGVITLPTQINKNYRYTINVSNYASRTINITQTNNTLLIVNFTFSPVITFGIFDEQTLGYLNFAHTTRVRYQVYCEDNTTIQGVIANSTLPGQFNLTFTCPAVKIRFLADYFAGTQTIYRTLVFLTPPTAVNFSVYLIDLTTSTGVLNNLIIQDLTSSYQNVRIEVTKLLPTGQTVMTTDYVDAEGKIAAYLLLGSEYYINVYSDNLPTKVLGRFYADVSGDKNLQLYNLVLTSSHSSFNGDVTWASALVNNSGTMTIATIYADFANHTINVTNILYNGSTCIGTPVFQQTINGPGVIQFSYNLPLPYNESLTLDYCSQVDIVGNGQSPIFIQTNQTIRGNQNIIVPGQFNNPWTLKWIIYLILLTIALGLNVRTASIGSLIIVGLAAFMVFIGWFNSSIAGVAIGVVLGIAALVALLANLKRGI